MGEKSQDAALLQYTISLHPFHNQRATKGVHTRSTLTESPRTGSPPSVPASILLPPPFLPTPHLLSRSQIVLLHDVYHFSLSERESQHLCHADDCVRYVGIDHLWLLLLHHRHNAESYVKTVRRQLSKSLKCHTETSFTGYMGLQLATNATQLSGAINALYQVGALFGTLSSGYTSDRFGRRKAIFLACIMVIIGGGLQAGSVHVAMFMAARFITGIGIGNLVTLIPTWQAELSNPHSRGLLVGLHGTFILVGYSSASWIGFGFSYVTNSHVQWRIPLLFQVIPPLILASGIFFVPESPRWLLQQGREAEALAVCKKIRRDSSAPDDGYAIAEFSSSESSLYFRDTLPCGYIGEVNTHSALVKAQYQYDLTMPSSWASIFSVRSYRRRALIGFSCLFLAQCTGTQVINNYGPTIYAFLGFNAKGQQLLAAGWITAGIPANFISALLMDKTGRVRMMQFGFLATGIALLGTTTSVAVGTSTGNTAALKAAVFFIYLHIATCVILHPSGRKSCWY